MMVKKRRRSLPWRKEEQEKENEECMRLSNQKRKCLEEGVVNSAK